MLRNWPVTLLPCNACQFLVPLQAYALVFWMGPLPHTVLKKLKVLTAGKQPILCFQKKKKKKE